MTMWILLTLAMAAEFGLHYFPWRMWLKGKELHRVAAYVLGLLGLMVPFSVWLWSADEAEIIPVLWLFIIAGGLTVFALYGLDRYLDLEMRDMEAGEAEELRKRHGTQG